MSLVPHGEPPAFFTFPALSAIGIPNATTTRHLRGMGTWSESAAPFEPTAGASLRGVGLDLARVAWARQVHGADVARAGAGGGFAGTADVLLTTEPGVTLAIFTADCLAIVAHAPGTRALAVAHVGWRGTVAGAAQATVGALGALGARPGDLHVTVGPSIGPCCYEVDAPVVERFSSAHAGLWERWFTRTSPGRWRLDLWAANADLLQRSGVAPARIVNPRLCTACHPELLFSYRKGTRGRLATLAALPP